MYAITYDTYDSCATIIYINNTWIYLSTYYQFIYLSIYYIYWNIVSNLIFTLKMCIQVPG